MAETSCSAGIIHWGRVRDLARLAQFEGRQVKMFESSGIFVREFRFSGDEAAIKAIDAKLMEWDEITHWGRKSWHQYYESEAQAKGMQAEDDVKLVPRSVADKDKYRG